MSITYNAHYTVEEEDNVHNIQRLEGKESRSGESNRCRPLTRLTPNYNMHGPSLAFLHPSYLEEGYLLFTDAWSLCQSKRDLLECISAISPFSCLAACPLLAALLH